MRSLFTIIFLYGNPGGSGLFLNSLYIQWGDSPSYQFCEKVLRRAFFRRPDLDNSNDMWPGLLWACRKVLCACAIQNPLRIYPFLFK